MSTSVSINGSTYYIPAYNDTGWAQGAGNLSSALIALAQSTLQTVGGTFTLSANVNFGATYGVIAAYLTSATASPATAGVIRLAAGDTIDWSTSNYALGENSGNLQWKGSNVVTVANLPSLAASYFSTTFSNQSSVTVTHNLGHYPLVQILDNSGNLTDPNSLNHGSVNAFTVTFIPNLTGTIIYVG